MKIDDDLEEIFRLAYRQFPDSAEYYLTRIMINMPEFVEKEDYDGSTYPVKNKEKLEVKDLISKLRYIR